MSATVTATLIPRTPHFPLLLPDVPRPHPTPLPPNSGRPPGRLSSRRTLRQEMDDLSDEENELDSYWKDVILHRGFSHLRVIGRMLTQQEEKNDQADSDSDETHESSSPSNGQGSPIDEDGNGSQQDLDASMEDLDEVNGREGQFDDSDNNEGDDDENLEDDAEPETLSP